MKLFFSIGQTRFRHRHTESAPVDFVFVEGSGWEVEDVIWGKDFENPGNWMWFLCLRILHMKEVGVAHLQDNNQSALLKDEIHLLFCSGWCERSAKGDHEQRESLLLKVKKVLKYI